MVSKFLFLVSLLFSIPCFSQDIENKLLNDAFKHNSEKELTAFFKGWCDEFKPIDSDEFSKLNDTIQAAYQVFAVVFDFLSPIKTKTSNNLTILPKYQIVQNEIYIRIGEFDAIELKDTERVVTNAVKELLKDSAKINAFHRDHRKPEGKWGTIAVENFYEPEKMILNEKEFRNLKDFRPNLLTSKNYKNVYLSPKYKTVIESFIENTDLDLLKAEKIGIKTFNKRLIKRKAFLDKCLAINCYSSGFVVNGVTKYVNLLNNLNLHSIILSKDLKSAFVDLPKYTSDELYRFELILKFENEKWNIIGRK